MYRTHCVLALLALYVGLAHSSTEHQPDVESVIIETTATRYEVEAGADVRLKCKVTPKKGTTVAWYRNNDQYFIGTIKLMLSNADRYTIAEHSKDLIIKNAQIDDSGVFRCETVQGVPGAINHTLLVTQKLIKPQSEKKSLTIETTSTQHEVEAGADVRLECKVTPKKGTIVAWYRNNEQYFIGNIQLMLSNADRYSIAEHSNDLIIKNAQVEDSGVFRCETVQKVPVAINHTLLVTQKLN